VKKGLGVVAISYDSRQILQNFSNRMKIGFPLLSDEGSVVIRSFGILNTSVTRGALDDGVPYPGIFIVDASGKVTAKYFEEKYQERFTPDTILSKEFGLTGGARFERRTDHLKLTAQVSQDKVRPGNRLTEHIHKAAGIVGVSAGVFGGARTIEHFQPVLRELGLVSILWDVNFGAVEKVFDSSGQLLDQAYVRRTDKFLNELIWMAKVLRYGRENISLE